MSNKELNLPRDQYEPVVSRSVELSQLGRELTLCVFDIHDDHEIKTCYGDICKIVDTLRDYAQLLEMVCDTWGLLGFHRATYELRAGELRKIAGKFQAGIGYDYDAAVERCEKRKGKKRRDEDVGGEAMTMAFIKSVQAAEAKERKAAEKAAGEQPAASEKAGADDPWMEAFDEL